MRKWHRWLSVLFGVFLLWIAVTGVLSQAAEWLPGPESSGPPRSIANPDFVCPPDMMCRPRPAPGSGGSLVGLFHHLHSGEMFGPVGVAISVLSGLAMIFFSASGLWMYVQMFRNRSKRRLKPRWFWR